MSDIVERLRRVTACEAGCNGRCRECPDTVAQDAAAEIERLRAELAKCRAELAEAATGLEYRGG